MSGILDGSCAISMQDLRWFQPGGIAPVARLCQDRGITSTNWPKSEDVCRYLDRMHLAKCFQLSNPPSYRRYPAGGRFIPAMDAGHQAAIEQVIRALKQMLSRTHLANGVQWALSYSVNEVLGNVLVHARDPEGGMIFGQLYDGRIEVAIVDSGIGIRESFRESGHEPMDDAEALQWAISQGISSKAGLDRAGNGLYLVKQVVEHNGPGASLTLFSGTSAIQIRAGHADRQYNFCCTFPGTVAVLEINTKYSVKMTEIIGHDDDLDDDSLWEG